MCWRSLSVTDALVALITNEYSVPRIRILMIGKGSSTTNVVRILMARMAWPVFLAYAILIAQSRCCRCDSSLTWNVATSALKHGVWQHLWYNVFPLADLRAVFQTVCLLGEENVSMIVRSLDNLRSSPAIFNIHAEALVWLGTLRTIEISIESTYHWTVHSFTASYWMIKRIMMIFIGLRGSICRSEAAKSRRIHLLLKQIARIGVVDVRAVLQSLH